MRVRHRARRTRAEFRRYEARRSVCVATASDRPGVRGAPVGLGGTSAAIRGPFGGEPVEQLAYLDLELVTGGAVDVEIAAERVAHRAVRLAAGCVRREEVALALSPHCLDALQ